MKKKIYWVGDTKTKQIYTDPYWEKQSAIIHIEETIFPKSWAQLYILGYRIKNREIEI